MSSYSIPTSLPKTISYFVNRLVNYSRNRVQLNMLTSTTVSSGQSFTVELPPNSLIDLDTLMLSFTATTTGGAGKHVGYMSATDLFHNVQVEVNGKIVQSLDYFNQLLQFYNAYQGASRLNVNKILLQNSTFSVTTTSNPNVGTSNNHAIFGNQWLGLLGSVQPRVWDTSIIGSTKITFRVASSEAFTSESDANPGVSLSNIRLEVDCLQLDSLYSEVVNRTLSSGGVLELPFQNYVWFLGQSQGLNGATLNFSLATQSLDAVVGTIFDNSGNSWKTNIVSDGAIAYFKKGSPNLTDSLLTINNSNYPSFGKSPIISDCVSTINNLLGYSPVTTTSASLDTLDEFKKLHYAKVVRLNHPDEGRLISGMNTLGTNMIGQFTVYGSNNDLVVPAIIALTTNTLQIGAGRMINVIS